MGKKSKQAAELIIKDAIGIIQERQREAQAAVDGASLLAKRGQLTKAVKVLMEFEGPARDSLDLFSAILMIKREMITSEPRQQRRDAE